MKALLLAPVLLLASLLPTYAQWKPNAPWTFRCQIIDSLTSLSTGVQLLENPYCTFKAGPGGIVVAHMSAEVGCGDDIQSTIYIGPGATASTIVGAQFISNVTSGVMSIFSAASGSFTPGSTLFTAVGQELTDISSGTLVNLGVFIGSQASQGGYTWLSFGGTATAGNVINVTFTNALVAGLPVTVPYTVTSADVTSGDPLSSIRNGVTAAINANTTLQTAQIFANLSADIADAHVLSPYQLSNNAGSTVVSYVQGGNTETLTVYPGFPAGGQLQSSPGAIGTYNLTGAAQPNFTNNNMGAVTPIPSGKTAISNSIVQTACTGGNLVPIGIAGGIGGLTPGATYWINGEILSQAGKYVQWTNNYISVLTY